ncbi:hypothetical protein RBWH47_04022 [Rhodopirellula baltica WH47]|uniref:Uncharacterized protein n=1 Tax=Rhodopirellula baltica WH47 TaxID=991778 RepID=F2ATZ9_RHOBT|nr:hypothetical protein RBWH47_04022 [Rhodopirellula baltica WH47]
MEVKKQEWNNNSAFTLQPFFDSSAWFDATRKRVWTSELDRIDRSTSDNDPSKGNAKAISQDDE